MEAARQKQTLLHQLNMPEINIATLPTYTGKKHNENKAAAAAAAEEIPVIRADDMVGLEINYKLMYEINQAILSTWFLHPLW